MPSCSFPNCKNTTKNQSKSSGITFHAFPSDITIHLEWVKNVRIARQNEEWCSNQYSRVCSDHFAPSQTYITKKGMRKIIKTAIPLSQVRREDINSVTHAVPRGTTPSTTDEPAKPSSGNISVPSSIFDTRWKEEFENRVKRLRNKNKQYRLNMKLLRKRNARLHLKCTALTSTVRDLKKKLSEQSTSRDY